MADEDAPAPATPVDESSADDPLAAAFAEVEARWDEPAAHKKFLALADTLDRMPEAGRRYRAIRETDAARADVAKTQIDALLALAMTRMKVEKTDPKPTRSRLEWIAFGVSAALIAAALWSMLRSF